MRTEWGNCDRAGASKQGEWWARKSAQRTKYDAVPQIGGETIVKNKDLEKMSVDELWILHEEIRSILSTKMDAEKRELERRLVQLEGRTRRSYPKVHAKYCNPERPSETWSGRGRQPRWVSAQLGSGKTVDEFLIARTH
jgi:DNA-binding protein H-NS